MKHFFISYNKADKQWAEWIAWILEEAGYSVVIQAWDFRPGENFALRMQEAASETERTIAVLSQSYLDAEYTQPEWAAAFTRDPQGKQQTLIPIRVRECSLEGLHSSLIYIDLIGRSEVEARAAILKGLKERDKPDEAPGFPGLNEEAESSNKERVAPDRVQYPGTTESSEIPWNVPQGVRFFTGREEVLNKLHEALKESRATALAQAISGLGGIGKTQTAIAYAQRHRAEYKAVLWAVAESRESLLSDFVALASVLNLIERNIQEQNLVIAAVKRWLDANSDWLLILDNADEPKLIEEFLPANPKGHILLTSRAQVFDDLGILNPVELEEMSPDDAKDFLLKRTGRSDLDDDESKAIEDLAKELDYLPLALEQAGAYIKVLRSRFQDYLASYRKRGLDLLEKSGPASKYRKSVRTTWSLNFQQVEQASKASADLLRVSAFLNPDRIPNELFRVGAVELGPELSAALVDVETDPLALDEVLKPLIQYSLIHRDRKSKSYDIHRLVQAVLKDGMDDATKREWVGRVVKTVARAFPNVDDISFSEWDRIERLLPHAQACIELIEQWQLDFLESVQLLNFVGRYLRQHSRLSELAVLYIDQGRYDEAETVLLRAVRNEKDTLRREHPRLSNLYNLQSDSTNAEVLYSRSLAIGEKILGSDHPRIVDILIELGEFYRQTHKPFKGEPLLRRAIMILRKTLGVDHPSVVSAMMSHAELLRSLNRKGEAQKIYAQAMKIQTKLNKERRKKEIGPAS